MATAVYTQTASQRIKTVSALKHTETENPGYSTFYIVEIIIIINFKPFLTAPWLSGIYKEKKFAPPKSETPSQPHQQDRSLSTRP